MGNMIVSPSAVKNIDSKVGDPSSASSVSGNDAFSKINTLNSNITTINSDISDLKSSVNITLPNSDTMIQTGLTVADFLQYKFVTFTAIANYYDYGIPVTMPTELLVAGTSFYIPFRGDPNIRIELAVDSVGVNVFYKVVGASIIELNIRRTCKL